MGDVGFLGLTDTTGMGGVQLYETPRPLPNPYRRGVDVDCSNCNRPTKVLKEDPRDTSKGICTICEITITKSFPGTKGLSYPNQFDPSDPDPQKALEFTLKEANQSNDPNQHLSNDECAFISRVHNVGFRNQALHKVPDRDLQRQRENFQDITRQDLDDHNKRTKMLEQWIGKTQSTFDAVKQHTGKGKPNTVVEIPL